MSKQRTHNAWFRPLTKTTCECGQKRTDVWSWGEYVRGNWRTVLHFCQNCYHDRVQSRLSSHTRECGCKVELKAYHTYLPDWLIL